MRSRLVGAAAAALMLMTGAAAEADSGVSLSPSSGHPGVSTTVAGASFGPNEAVDVYVDTTDTALLVTNSSGAFSGSVFVPASAGPGSHTITAVGRRSGDAAQASFRVTTPWALPGFGAADLSFNPYENTVTPATATQLGVLWGKKLNSTGGTLIVAGDVLYHGTANGVQAVRAATGEVLWTNAKSETFYATPALVNGVLYAASAAGNVYALNATTGAVLWRLKMGGSFYGSPNVVNGVVYIGNFANNLYALRASDGHVLWTFSGAGFDTTPAVANGMVFAGSLDDNMYALNASTGAVVWSFATHGPVESSAAVANNMVFFGSDDGSINVLDADYGTVVWGYVTSGAIYGHPAVAEGFVYVGSADGYLYAFKVRTGDMRWKLQLNSIVRGPVVAGGMVYVSEDASNMAIIDPAAGNVLGIVHGGSSYFGSPSVSDGVVYLDARGGRTFALGLKAGTNAVPPHAKAPDPTSLVPDASLTAAAAISETR